MGGLDGAGNEALRSRGPTPPRPDRFGDRWRRALLEGDTEEREVLLDFRSTLTQYVKAYAFFAQLIDYGNPRYLKLSVYADLLARQLRAFTTEVTDPGEVDVSDIILTHYKLEKLRTEDLALSEGEPQGLDGLTEAGMAKARERERSAKSEIVEKVNKYLGDLDVDDRYKVDKIESLLAEVAADDNLRAIAKEFGVTLNENFLD